MTEIEGTATEWYMGPKSEPPFLRHGHSVTVCSSSRQVAPSTWEEEEALLGRLVASAVAVEEEGEEEENGSDEADGADGAEDAGVHGSRTDSS